MENFSGTYQICFSWKISENSWIKKTKKKIWNVPEFVENGKAEKIVKKIFIYFPIKKRKNIPGTFQICHFLENGKAGKHENSKKKKKNVVVGTF